MVSRFSAYHLPEISMAKQITFLARLTAEDVRRRMRAFPDSYKRHWQQWLRVAPFSALDAPMVAKEFRALLQRWQAVRSRTKGRVVRHCRASKNTEELCLDDLLRKATPFVRELDSFSLREANALNVGQERALKSLWDIFLTLPSIGTANAVGITKAVKLVTLGRVGPALDAVVRRNLGIDEPYSADEWLAILRAISVDLSRFEGRTHEPLEALVDAQWRPIAVGRAYDMVAGPT